MAHLRSTVWGPAEFVGAPPWWLVRKGLLVGLLGAGTIVCATLFGAWTGTPSLADGEAGLVCAAVLTLYLIAVRAGRAPAGIVAVLGVFLALQAPQAAAGVVLAERGQVRSAVVTSVGTGPGTGGRGERYLCSVADADGVPLGVRIWRGCGHRTRPGDTLAVVYDPEGHVPPRGVQAGTAGPLRDLWPWTAALVTGCLVAVVRSHRISPTPAASPAGPGTR